MLGWQLTSPELRKYIAVVNVPSAAMEETKMRCAADTVTEAGTALAGLRSTQPLPAMNT